MKQIIIKGLIILCSIGIIFSINSCKKSKLNKQTTTTMDNGTAENMFADVFKVVNDAAQNTGEVNKTSVSGSSGLCWDTITIDRPFPDTTFPKTIIIDFGTIGNYCTDGRTRKGKIVAVFTGRYRNAGTVITVTPQNYYVNGHKVEGSKTITNKGNATGNFIYTVVVDGKVTTSAGDVIIWKSTRTNEWIEGDTTFFNICDDVYSITGSANGTNREGRDFTVNITSPLIKQICCKWIKKGTIEIIPEDLATRTVDFGDGACDDIITVKIKKRTYTIYLP